MQRTRHLRQLSDLARAFPIMGIVGPRQVGKSTLARQLASETSTLDRLYVIHAGTASFPMADRVDAVAIQDVWQALPSLV